MKFLIDNFSESDSTQSMYLNKHLNELGCVSNIRLNPNQTLYDSFDALSPNFYVTSAKGLSQDAVLYFQENQHKNMSLILCVTNADQKSIEKIEEFLVHNKIQCGFLFGNKADIKTRKLRYVNIQESADMNISANNPLNYKIDKAIIATERSIIKKYIGTYHVISTSQNMEKCDFYSPIAMLTGIYNNYDEVILTDFNGYIPQVFFDAVARGLKVYYDINDVVVEQKADELFSKVFKIDGSLNYNSSNKINDFTALKSYILDKHTGLNRAKTILSQLPKVDNGANK